MKKVLILLVYFVSLCANAQSNYRILQKFKFHSLEIRETNTENLLDEFPEGEGLVINCMVEGIEYLLISIPGVHDYNIQIVHKVLGAPVELDGIKMDLYQGGEKIEGLGVYTCNVFYVYDIEKNKTIPQFIRLEINGSPNLLYFNGIIKLED